jgi:hypothetical protein
VRGGAYSSYAIDALRYSFGTSNDPNDCDVAVADFNRDGKIEVVLSQSENHTKSALPVILYRAISNPLGGQAAWSRTVIDATMLREIQTLEAADLDNDGDIDIMAAKFELPSVIAGRPQPPYPINVYWNRGDNKTFQKENVANGGLYSALVADVGSDGKKEIVGMQSYWKPPFSIYKLRGSPGAALQTSGDAR